MGGDRHHPLVVAVARSLAAAGVAALRLDLRDPDLGTSSEALEAAAVGLRTELAVDRLALVGYSWGSAVSAVARPAGLAARVLVAPPVNHMTVGLPTGEVPTLVLVPAHDQYGPPEAVEDHLAGRPGCEIEIVPGADHFLVGSVDRIASRATAWLSVQLP
jgi:alpha/beta superfamily hydrolase